MFVSPKNETLREPLLIDQEAQTPGYDLSDAAEDSTEEKEEVDDNDEEDSCSASNKLKCFQLIACGFLAGIFNQLVSISFFFLMRYLNTYPNKEHHGQPVAGYNTIVGKFLHNDNCFFGLCAFSYFGFFYLFWTKILPSVFGIKMGIQNKSDYYYLVLLGWVTGIFSVEIVLGFIRGIEIYWTLFAYILYFLAILFCMYMEE